MADLTPGDKAQAEALRIAHELLSKSGWKFTAVDVGAKAREILIALTEAPAHDR